MDKEIYKLALEAIDHNIEEKKNEIYALEEQLSALKKKREEIRLQTRSELEVFMEKYPGLSSGCSHEVKISRAKHWINRPEAEVLAEIRRIEKQDEEYELREMRLNSAG